MPRRHNSQTERDRCRLVEDFERRVRSDEATGDRRHLLPRPRSMAWVVHPCADEAALLTEFGMTPDACRNVEAYWRYEDNVYFVQVTCADIAAKQVSIRYRFDRLYRQDQFVVSLPTHPICTGDLNGVFERLEQLVDSGIVTHLRRALRAEPGRWLDAPGPIVAI